MLAVVCGTGRRGCRVSDAALRGIDFGQADGIDGALLRGTIATSSSRRRCCRRRRLHHRRRWSQSERERQSEERAARAVSALAGVRSLAATPTNGVVDARRRRCRRRRRRRLRARSRRVASRRAEPSRHDTDGRAADTHLRQSRAVVRLPVVRGAA